jgi:hypothetical protein
LGIQPAGIRKLLLLDLTSVQKNLSIRHMTGVLSVFLGDVV